MKKIALVLVYSLTGYFLFGQKFTPGFVVKMNGDTLKGNIFFEHELGSVQQVHLKTGYQDQFFKSSDIKSAGNATITYLSGSVKMDMSPNLKESEVDTIFAELLVQGKMCLLYFEDRFQKTHFIVQGEDNQWQELVLKVIDGGNGVHFIKLPGYKGTLKKIFPNCQSIFPDIDDAAYTANSLRKVFAKCLECTYGKETIKKIKTAKTYFDYGVLGGIARTRLVFRDDSGVGYRAGEYTFDKSLNITGGMYLDLRFSKMRKFSFRGELIYKGYKASSPEVVESSLVQRTTQSSGFVSASYLKFNLMTRIHFLYNKVSPFISLGASPAFLLSHKDYANVTETEFGVTSYYQVPIFSKVSSIETGEFVGLGVNASNFGIEMRVELSSGLQPKEAESSVLSLYGMAYYRLNKRK